MSDEQNLERLRITAFNAGRVFEQRRYCKKHFSDVYNKIKTLIYGNATEVFIKPRDIEDYCYSKTEILDIITKDINEANMTSNHKKVSIDKRYLFKGWRLVIA